MRRGKNTQLVSYAHHSFCLSLCLSNFSTLLDIDITLTALFGEAEARNKRAVEFRSYDRLIDVYEADSPTSTTNNVVAKVRTVLYIEDLGAADETAVPLKPKVTVESEPLVEHPNEHVEVIQTNEIDESRLRQQITREVRHELEQEMEETFKKRLREVMIVCKSHGCLFPCLFIFFFAGNMNSDFWLQLEKQWASREAARQKEFDLVR